MKYLLILFALPLFAQTNTGVRYVTTAPSGSCSARAQLTEKTPDGDLYTCSSGTWRKTASGSTGASPAGSNTEGQYRLNATTFGATTGSVWVAPTGTADQVVIAAAITALPATGGVVNLLAGTYTFSAPLDIETSNVTLAGQGRSTKLILANATNTDVLDVGITVAISNVTVRDLIVDGNNTNQTVGTDRGIRVGFNTTSISVLNCTVQNTRSTGVEFDGTGVLKDSTLSTTGTGVYNLLLQGSNISVLGNTMSGGALGTIRLSGSSNDTIESNNLTGAVLVSSGTGNHFAYNSITSAATITLDTSGDVENSAVGNFISVQAAGVIGLQVGSRGFVAGNIIETVSTATNAIGINQAASDAELTGNFVHLTSSSGNRFKGIQADDFSNVKDNSILLEGSRDATGISSLGQQVTITGNSIDFEGSSANYIGISGNTGDIISNNFIYSPSSIGISSTGTGGTVSGNRINFAGTGISISSATSTAISDNTLIGNGSSGGAGITITSSSLGISVTGNSISSFANEGIKLTTVSNSVISGNTIKDVGQATNNTYAAILLAGANSTNNTVTANAISSVAVNKHSYGVRENDASQGPTTIMGNTALNAVTSNYSIQNASSLLYNSDVGPGTTTTVLHGNATGSPSFGAVSLTADVSGVLPTANIATALANQTSINGLGITASTGTLTVPNGVTMTGPASTGTVAALNQTNTFTSAAIVDLSAASTTAGLKIPAAAGAAPTADDFIAFNTTNHTHVWGSNGTTMVGAIAATGTGTATTCTNQFITAVSSLAVPTCTTATLAGAQFANQGTTTTLLHGNGAGNPSFGNVVGGDFGSSITARTAFGNPSASAGAPSFSTTADVLAYQTAEIPAYVFVTSNFTTSGSGTALEAITGLTWTMPGSTALNIPFHCALVYHQNTANAAVGFGFQNATTGATNLLTSGIIYTSATVFAAANVANTTATTATTIVSGTPSAITTNWNATLDGLIEQPSGTASVFTIRVSTATQGDTVTVLRGSYCRVG